MSYLCKLALVETVVVLFMIWVVLRAIRMANAIVEEHEKGDE